MRPFYIIKNKYGFYSVSFVNQTIGKRTAWKSTHTADYSEAMLIARLSDSEAKLLYIELAAKFDSSIPVLNTTPTPVVKSAPINELSVEEPAPKKKVVVVHKKNALADS